MSSLSFVTMFVTLFVSTASTSAKTSSISDVNKRNWSALGVRGAWGKRSTDDQAEENEAPSSHYIVFTHDDFNSKLGLN